MVETFFASIKAEQIWRNRWKPDVKQKARSSNVFTSSIIHGGGTRR